MANAVYPKYKEALLSGAAAIDLITNTATDGLYGVLVDTGVYTYNAAHQYYSSLSGLVGTEQRIVNPTVVNGLLDGNDITEPAVTGASAEAIVLFRKNSGANTTWRLVAYLDTGVTGLPVTPNSGDINIVWNASGILQL